MLIVDKLNQYYGGSHILRDVAFDVPDGKCTTLLGRNGVGKTTLLKCLVGLLPVKTGVIGLAGHDLTHAPSHKRVRAGLGYVPQGRDIFPLLSVEENLRIGAFAGEANGAASARQFSFDDVFHTFPVLKTMRRRIAGNLSGGQQQQLAIGRALVLEPSLLILDEPTEGIQPNIVHEIGDVILELNRGGVTVLLVEQKLPFARRVASEFRILEKGRCVAGGTIAELTDDVVRAHLSV